MDREKIIMKALKGFPAGGTLKDAAARIEQYLQIAEELDFESGVVTRPAEPTVNMIQSDIRQTATIPAEDVPPPRIPQTPKLSMPEIQKRLEEIAPFSLDVVIHSGETVNLGRSIEYLDGMGFVKLFYRTPDQPEPCPQIVFTEDTPPTTREDIVREIKEQAHAMYSTESRKIPVKAPPPQRGIAPGGDADEAQPDSGGLFSGFATDRSNWDKIHG